VAYACAQARLLQDLLQGRSLEAAVDGLHNLADGRTALGRELRDMLNAVEAALADDVETATERFGRACGLQKAFPAALHTALVHRGDFRAAIAACAHARGDSASRAMLVGSWLGASLGSGAIPPDWLERLADRTEIAQGIEHLLAARTAPALAH
jgi:ADP-ribosylglycohydrolase